MKPIGSNHNILFLFHFEVGLNSEVVVCVLIVQIDGYKFALKFTSYFIFDSSHSYICFVNTHTIFFDKSIGRTVGV